MAKQQKAKTGQTRNDSRKNGKSAKQNPGRKVTGSKGGGMPDSFLVLLGKGPYQKVANRAHAEKLKAKSSARKKKDR